MRRLELESEALDRRSEIFFGPGDEENWLHQLFSPSFVIWLAEETPEGLAFELSVGALCVNVDRRLDEAAQLDGFCRAAAVVAARIAEEASE
ncbi:MAG: hypothetical protein ACR2K6_07205 [Solirubrobacterales bacterium]